MNRQDETGRDRWRTAAWLLLGLLLLGGLFWWLLSDDPGAMPRQRSAPAKPIQLMLSPPPKEQPRPPRVPMTRAVRPAPENSRTTASARAPAAPAREQARPFALDTETEPVNDYNVQQGTQQGFVIGGGGQGGNANGNGSGNGDGGGCVNTGRYAASSYPTLVTSQVRKVFSGRSGISQYRFRIQTRLWFAADGRIRRSQLVGSTGDVQLDRLVTTLLETLDIAVDVPQCLQPFTVWVSQPWNGSFGEREGEDGPERGNPGSTVIWRTPR